MHTFMFTHKPVCLTTRCITIISHQDAKLSQCIWMWTPATEAEEMTPGNQWFSFEIGVMIQMGNSQISNCLDFWAVSRWGSSIHIVCLLACRESPSEVMYKALSMLITSAIRSGERHRCVLGPYSWQEAESTTPTPLIHCWATLSTNRKTFLVSTGLINARN